MGLIDKLKDKIRENIKTIILPEANDERILKAARYITDNKLCKIILIGNKEEVIKNAELNNINLNDIEIINPLNYNNIEKLINEFYELRKDKDITIDIAKEMILNNYLYFGAMLVRDSYADGMVCGVNHKSSETFKAAFQVIGTRENLKASSFFIMEFDDKNIGKDGILLYADCGLNQNPSSEELADIAYLSSNSFKYLIHSEPYTAFLSHSTLSSSNHPDVDKVKNAVMIAKYKYPMFKFDGEMQFDAAIDSEVAKIKSISEEVAGHANVLIFPDLDSGNIAYKITERLAHAKAYGPFTQGLNKPVNDLSRGSSIEDIIGVIVITAYQAIKY